MKSIPVTLACLLAFYQQQAIQVDVRLQQVTAVVRDNSGRFVLGLKAEDFILEEDGVRQDITNFQEESMVPISLGILADDCWEQSGIASALNHIDGPRAIDVTALDGIIGPQDEVSLMGCKDGLAQNTFKVYEDFTSDRRRIERHLGRASGSILDGNPGCCRVRTTRFEVIQSALKKMKTANNRKRALVFIPSGTNVIADEKQNFAKLLATIAQFEIPVYLFRRDDPKGHLDLTPPSLAQLAEESGGGVFQYPVDSAAPEVARSLEADIRSQYSIGYYLKASAPSSERTIRARTTVPDHHVIIHRSVNPAPGR